MQKKIISFIVWTTFLSQQVFAQACFDAKCCCVEGQQNTIPKSHQHGKKKSSTQISKLEWDGPGPRHFEGPQPAAVSDENNINIVQADSLVVPHCHQQKASLATPAPNTNEASASDQYDLVTVFEDLSQENFSVPPLAPSGDLEQTTILLETSGEKVAFVGLDTDDTIQISVLAKTSNDNECACEKMSAAGIYSCTCGKKVLSTPSPIQLFQALTWEKIYQLAFDILPLKNLYFSVPDKSPDPPPPKHLVISDKKNLV